MTVGRIFGCAAIGALLAQGALADNGREGATGPAAPGQSFAARASLTNADGVQIGTVYAEGAASGTTIVTVALTEVPEGTHALHIHAEGSCGGENFAEAGPIVAGEGTEHGIGNEAGHHPGDLPNVTAPASGDVNVEFFAPTLDVNRHLIDPDGAAVLLHARADDYVTQPEGDAGPAIACGTFEQAATD